MNKKIKDSGQMHARGVRQGQGGAGRWQLTLI